MNFDVTLTETEIKLAARLLKVASNSFANHGCNDFDMTFLSVEERREIIKAYAEWNGDPEDFNSNNEYELWTDWALMQYISDKLVPLDDEYKKESLRKILPSEKDLAVTKLKEWANGNRKLDLYEIADLIVDVAKKWNELKYK